MRQAIYKSVPTFRNYSDYHDAEQYVKGWNDAMHFIFDDDKEKKINTIKLLKKEVDT